MGERGPRTKPIEVKRRNGNPGKRALPAVGQLAAVPVAEPESFEQSVEEALRGVMAAGVHWLASTDTPVICLLRETVEHYAALRGDPRTSTKELIDVRAQMMRMLAELGFSPTARSALGLAEVKAASKLEQLRKSKGNA